MLSQKFGCDLGASGERDQETVGDVALGQANFAGERSIDVHVDLRIVEHLLDAQIGDAGNRADALEQVRGIGVVGLLIATNDLNVDRRRQAEVQDLRDDIGRQERKGRPRKLLRQHGA